jgi:hypothetical protein
MLSSISVYATEQLTQFPNPCYVGKNLAKIQEWEQQWVGKKIDSNNVDEVKEFVPETLYNLMKDTKNWGDSWFEIVPYREYKMSDGTINATKMHASQCSLGPQEELTGWVSGVPFPEPKSGVEIAWNFYCWTRGDTQKSIALNNVVDGIRKYDRNVSFNMQVSYFSGRRDVPPTPEVPQNSKGIYRGLFAEFVKPTELKGFLNLQITYKDFLKSYDSWVWIAALRRIRRQSTEQRTDTVGGQDNTYDDNYGWDGAITRNTYKLLGRKELLLARHQDLKSLKHTEGDCVLDGIQRERINTWVVEVVNKDPNYIYKKCIWYMDPELWHITYTDRYDKYGRLWKTMEHLQTVYKGYNGQDTPFFCCTSTIDHQRKHASLGTVQNQMGVDIPLNVYSLSYLEKFGH